MSAPNSARVPLQSLPRFAKGWTFLYVEHAVVDREKDAIRVLRKEGSIPVPVSCLSTLLLGPGTKVTHEAMKCLADSGCSTVWVGEHAVRTYAAGLGETRQARNLQVQATTWADPKSRMQVVRRMYALRFDEVLEAHLTLQQIRGKEGVRVRTAYAQASEASGVPWHGRSYDRRQWGGADDINRALSTANACLYGLCHAAIVSTGFSPGLGFIHTGKLLSFVYDVADLYKAEVCIPVAFHAVATNEGGVLSQQVRRACRDAFRTSRLLTRIVPDMQRVLGLKPDSATLLEVDADPGTPEGLSLWDPGGAVPAGANYALGQESG